MVMSKPEMPEYGKLSNLVGIEPTPDAAILADMARGGYEESSGRPGRGLVSWRADLRFRPVFRAG